MRLVVTGAGGGLGRALLDSLPAHHDVAWLTHQELDVGDPGAVIRAIPALRPDAVLNLAAFTDVDGNERDPARAFRDNAAGPQSVALAARAADAILLHVSTDYVFDGAKPTPYDEGDEPRPRSVYGRAKLLGERLVRAITPLHVIVRVGHVFGAGDDFLSGQVRRLRQGETAGGLVDRTGTPTWVRDIADRLVPLVLAARWGTYHLAGPDATTWFDVLGRCRRLGDLPGDVLAQHAAELGLVAPRPANSALTSVLLPATSVPPMPALDDSLAAFLKEVD